MRFAFAGTDRYHGVFEAFVSAGWQPLKLFTVPVANAVDNHAAVVALAQQHNAPVQFTRLGEDDFKFLAGQECQALIVGCYPWRIGPWQDCLHYAVNFHCAPLPEGRGPYPITRAILEGRASWAIACHRLEAEIDTGAVLAMERFSLEADECHERLDLKTQMAAKRLARRMADYFPELWVQAMPQGEGSYWPNYTLAERVIDFNQPVAAVLRHIRAFGATESLARVNGTWVVVKRAVGWSEPSSYPAGAVAHIHNRTVVVAAKDGYVGLVEADLARSDLLERLAKAGIS
jgi:methionyl-tRNA formyltransferase